MRLSSHFVDDVVEAAPSEFDGERHEEWCVCVFIWRWNPLKAPIRWSTWSTWSLTVYKLNVKLLSIYQLKIYTFHTDALCIRKWWSCHAFWHSHAFNRHSRSHEERTLNWQCFVCLLCWLWSSVAVWNDVKCTIKMRCHAHYNPFQTVNITNDRVYQWARI